MNLNIKLDDEEEQAVPYVNRFAINIPSNAPALSLNIVNPGLSGQSYILNPVTSVGQNIVTYQPVQSYIALPAENEGNLLHSLPVGVSVPVGLPVPASLLPNHNFMNTSIIIRNEDSSNLIKSQNHGSSDSEIKLSYIEKAVQEISNHNVDESLGIQSVELNCSAQPDVQRELEAVIKKPCPLEMSIKAANIDLEFEKCKSDEPISTIMPNCQFEIEKQPIIVESVSLGEELKGGILKVPLEIPGVQINKNIIKASKTEITWENNNVKGNVTDNGFQESLICEVEEVNDDEDEGEEEDDDEEEEEEEEENEEDKNVDEKIATTSSEESDSLPLSVALKLNKKPKLNVSERRKKHKIENSSSEKSHQEEGGKRKRSQKSKKVGKEDESESSCESEEELNLTRIKNEFNYKCYYEPKNIKSAALKGEDKSKKFIRVRNCCTKRDCGNKISVQDQKIAHKNFYELESNVKRDAYLVNCIEHVVKNKNFDGGERSSLSKQEEKKLLDNATIQLEIENESNGNQKLSDEIQNAINESLKDCLANEETRQRDEREDEGGEKNSWNFYIVIDRCRKKVCLQFLLKLFRITKSRIKQLQKKILLGAPISEEVLKPNPKSEIWDLAKSHLYSLAGEECADCDSIPRHKFLTEPCTRDDLFSNFKLFYLNKLGTEANIKFKSYKRFLDKKTSIAFTPNIKGVCTGCEEMDSKQKKKANKTEKKPSKTKKAKTSSENKKQWMVKSDSEKHSSDDEPLLKRKKLKLTIPLKAVDGKTQDNRGKRNGRGSGVEKKTKGRSNKERTKHTSSRGRDVWSLMLLHLGTMPYKESSACVSKKKHRFLDPTFTTQGLFEDYRKYFLKETNSELGLGFTMYEKYFNRNCNYTIADVDVNAPNCPSCTAALKS